MPRKYLPNRGDVVWISFTPQAGHEQAGHRPALVLSPQAYTAKTGLALVCPITSSVKNYPFEVALPANFLINGVILADQIKSLDVKARGITFIAAVQDDIVDEVIAKLTVLL